MMLVIALVPFGMGPRPSVASDRNCVRGVGAGSAYRVRAFARSEADFAEGAAVDFVAGVGEVVAVGDRAGVEIDRLTAGVVRVVPVADDESVAWCLKSICPRK